MISLHTKVLCVKIALICYTNFVKNVNKKMIFSLVKGSGFL